jgi:DNA polymerase
MTISLAEHLTDCPVTMSIDIETYSSVDLRKSGVYRYTESPDFKVLMIAYKFSCKCKDEIDDEVSIYDSHDMANWTEMQRLSMINRLTNHFIIKSAYNANFERVCLSKFFGVELPPEQWRCTMVHALELGLPGSLEEVAKALGVAEQKDAQGKRLIKKYCMPNRFRQQNLPSDDLVDTDWQAFKEYCKQDVRTEMAIRKKLEMFPLHDDEWTLWAHDQAINDRGIEVDPVLVVNAIHMNDLYCDKLENEAIRLTGLSNPNSLQQLKEWFKQAEGLEIEDLKKQTIPELLNDVQSDTARRMLEIRQELSKTSVKKYHAMYEGKCQDNRLRGLLQFYGAGRTGRWAGRMVQVQNLPGHKLVDLDNARRFVRAGDYEITEMLYDSVPNVLSQLIRTAFVPRAGHRFIVADFSAIEARVIAWLAGEQWRLDVFNTHGKIYEASAAQMFNVPLESIGKGSPLRQKGKVAELALGYQGGPNALIAMGALNMGLTEDELPDIVKAWRNANPAIVALWNDLEQGIAIAIQHGKKTGLDRYGKYLLNFNVEKNIAFIKLPSGRRLAYVKPELQPHKRFEGKNEITYMGVDQMTRKWTRLSTYGGKLVENVVQAIARDCLAESLKRLHAAGLKVVMHVHDEVVLEVPIGVSSAEQVAEIMGEPIEWAPGLPLRADAFETDYYRKD